jgi:hypothetical protein
MSHGVRQLQGNIMHTFMVERRRNECTSTFVGMAAAAVMLDIKARFASRHVFYTLCFWRGDRRAAGGDHKCVPAGEIILYLSGAMLSQKRLLVVAETPAGSACCGRETRA